ncbi:hypothetical protein BS78_03G268000, partial [Paspalum vaginatum]
MQVWSQISQTRASGPTQIKVSPAYLPLARREELVDREKNRILSALERTGKATRQVTCKGCGELGHRQGSWRCGLTGTRKRKGQQRQKNKVGRKPNKSKEVKEKEPEPSAPEPSSQTTPRTRAAVAREAAKAPAVAALAGTPEPSTPTNRLHQPPTI